MKFKLKINNSLDHTDIWEVVKILEENLSPPISHQIMTMNGFFRSKKWRIDFCQTHWELVLDRRHTTKPWFIVFLLKWT